MTEEEFYRRRRRMCETFIDTVLTSRTNICIVVLHLKQGRGLNDDISYYEPLSYYTDDVLHDHNRAKRDLFHTVRLNINAFGRSFNIRLKPNKGVLSDDIEVSTSNEDYHYDGSGIYKGYIANEDHSIVHGIINSQGHFDGKIWTPFDQFIIGPSLKYYENEQPFHSIIYRLSDITFNQTNIDNKSIRDLLKFKARLNVQDMSVVSDNHNTRHINHNIQYFHQHTRRRRAVLQPKTTCELYVKADNYFYNAHGNSPDLVINEIVQFVQTINTIFSPIDFDRDGSNDNIKFTIKKIKLYTNASDPDYARYVGNMDVVKFLESHSEENYDDYCLSYILTHRDFGEGVLGLAWTASQDENQVGGVCEKYKVVNGKSQSLNTGIVTTLNYGQTVPSLVSHLTLAHEIGHNMGSDHDPDNVTCTPSGTGGNYIMYPKATSGKQTNNQFFSTCSINYMSPIITSRGTGLNGCFTADSGSICGNKVIDEGEECDCGWEDECQEYCCNARGGSGTPCTLKSNATCSTSANYNAECPEPQSLPNKTVCDGSRVCMNGECTGSICLAYDYEPCQCSPTEGVNWKDEVLCAVCCIVNEKCTSSFEVSFMPNLTMVPGSPCYDNEGYCDVFSRCREVDPSGFYNDLSKWLISSSKEIESWISTNWWAAALIALGLVIILGLFVKFCSKSPSKVRREKWEEHQRQRQTQDGFRMQQPQQRRLGSSTNRVAPVFTTRESRGGQIQQYRNT
ncbi:hypothetical protein LOTGIDRAFT_235956 [Lottia gigantea]|uniref:ADAM10 endopeptidase n=1 Tax=Lottia gigantea TaxID=225164 RepID=V3ZLC7_LOTGI|nr:hypothetical protein LOTGIDRAFT_235956 [Lottia gigantea]ESO85097.1 hypothetical protein LOTGIDRAFT_235956 [Lottia gigantea]